MYSHVSRLSRSWPAEPRTHRGPGVRWLSLLVAFAGLPSVASGQLGPSSVPLQLADNEPVFFTVAYPTRHRLDARNATALRTRIAVDLHGATIAEAIDAVAKGSGLVINYSSDVLPRTSDVSLVARDISVEGALSVILLDAGLDVQLTGDQLTLVPHARTTHARNGTQESRITGRVLDADTRAPIEAAAILVTGTTVGVNTSDSGTFVLRLPPDAKTLTVRRIGYLAQVVTLATGTTDYTITLQKDVLRLQTQVVTGVATTVSSQNAANAVSVVSSEAVAQVPSPTIENSLVGKVPGAVIQQNNGGAPGGGLQVEIRGVTSINGNTTPLYVVDGVIVNNTTVNTDLNAITGASGTGAPNVEDNSPNRIADLNPDDIESVEILKGASASAIYGSKASAGVVIITTKRGAAGRAQWSVNGQIGHFSLANSFPMRTFPTLASAQAWYIGDITHDSAAAAVAADNAFISSVYAGPQDFQSQLFGNSQASYQADVSVTGTAGSTQYFLSGLSKYDNGIQLNSGYNKQSIRTNVTQQFASALSLTANLNYIHDVTRRSVNGNDNLGIAPYSSFSTTPQFLGLSKQNPDGSWPVNPFGTANVFADAMEIATPEEMSRFIGGGSVNWTPWRTEHQSLQINLVGGADLASLRDLFYAPPTLQVEATVPSGLPGVSVSNVSQTNFFNYSINAIHHFTGIARIDATTAAGFVRERRDFSNPVTVGYNLLAGVNAPTVGTVQSNFFTRTAQRDQSFYAQEQVLALNSRLSVTAGLTAERSTNDGDINKFYYYPHYAASYRIPQFVGFLDEVKLRAAYGQSGNLGPYGKKYSPFVPALIAGLNVVEANSQLGDPNLKPESEQETELGFDATMFKSRAQFSATIYQKRLTNLLLQAQVAQSEGYTSVYENGGEFTNQGIELSLQATPVQLRNGLDWTTTVSFYRNYSVVNALPVPPFTSGGIGFGGGFLAPGRSVTEAINTNLPGAGGLPLQIGDFQPGDYVSLGNEFTWHNFRVYGMVVWSRGASLLDGTDLYFDLGGGLYPDSALASKRLGAFFNGADPYMQPASFFRVRELTVSYMLPQKFVSRIGFGRLRSARISLSGYNLWTSTSYDGLDPEASFLGAAAIARADVTPYPPNRSYFLGLNLGL